VQADQAVETIQREMTTFARRARASAGRLHPELSLVCTRCSATWRSATAAGHRPGAHYALDKSTVIRQVHRLERAGLIERRVDAEDHRVQVAAPDRRRPADPRPGHRDRQAAFQERLTDWPERT